MEQADGNLSDPVAPPIWWLSYREKAEEQKRIENDVRPIDRPFTAQRVVDEASTLWQQQQQEIRKAAERELTTEDKQHLHLLEKLFLVLDEIGNIEAFLRHRFLGDEMITEIVHLTTSRRLALAAITTDKRLVRVSGINFTETSLPSDTQISLTTNSPESVTSPINVDTLSEPTSIIHLGESGLLATLFMPEKGKITASATIVLQDSHTDIITQADKTTSSYRLENPAISLVHEKLHEHDAVAY